MFTDEQWGLIEPLLPSSDGLRGRAFRNNRLVVEGIAYRYRAGWHGVICPQTSVRGRRCGNDTAAMPVTERGIECSRRC